MVVLKENRKLVNQFKMKSDYKLVEGGVNAFGLVEAVLEEGEGEGGEPKVWRRRILSCSMTTSRRILKRALSGIFWRRRRRRSDVLRKDIFAVVDYL